MVSSGYHTQAGEARDAESTSSQLEQTGRRFSFGHSRAAPRKRYSVYHQSLRSVDENMDHERLKHSTEGVERTVYTA